MAALDATAFPHIVARILSFASHDTLLAARAASRDLRDRADALLYYHVALDMASDSERERAPAQFPSDAEWPLQCKLMSLGPSPDSTRPLTPWNLKKLLSDDPALPGRLRLIRVLDVRRDLHFNALGAMADILSRNNMMLDAVRLESPHQEFDDFDPSVPFPARMAVALLPPPDERVLPQHLSWPCVVVQHVPFAVYEDEPTPQYLLGSDVKESVLIFTRTHPQPIPCNGECCTRGIEVPDESRRWPNLVRHIAYSLAFGAAVTLVDLQTVNPMWLMDPAEDPVYEEREGDHLLDWPVQQRQTFEHTQQRLQEALLRRLTTEETWDDIPDSDSDDIHGYERGRPVSAPRPVLAHPDATAALDRLRLVTRDEYNANLTPAQRDMVWGHHSRPRAFGDST